MEIAVSEVVGSLERDVQSMDCHCESVNEVFPRHHLLWVHLHDVPHDIPNTRTDNCIWFEYDEISVQLSHPGRRQIVWIRPDFHLYGVRDTDTALSIVGRRPFLRGRQVLLRGAPAHGGNEKDGS